MDIFLLTTQLFDPWICATFEISFAKQAVAYNRSVHCRSIRHYFFVFRQPKSQEIKYQVNKPSSKYKNQATNTRNQV